MLARTRLSMFACFLLWILSVSACGQEDGSADRDASVAAETPDSLACREDDGRCVVCIWQEQGKSRCRITIFAGTCSNDSVQARGASCPPKPLASCERSPGYLRGEAPYADVDLYYDPAVLADAEADCAASTPSLSETVDWSVYE